MEDARTGSLRAQPADPVDDLIRVVVGEDHPPLRRRAIVALEDDPSIVVVGEAGDSDRLVAVCRDQEPDCVVVGTAIEPLRGAATVARVRAEAPPAGIAVMGSHSDEGEALEALRAGATGFVNRDRLGQAPEVVRAVHGGVVALPPLVARLVADELAGDRRGPRPEPDAGTAAPAVGAPDGLQVLEHLAAGRSYSAAAEALGVDPGEAKSLVAEAVGRLRGGA